jgi:hypothetical protein
VSAELLGHPDLGQPVPQVAGGGELGDADRREAQRVEVGDERRLGADHDRGVRPLKRAAHRAHARLGEQRAVAVRVAAAAEEVEVCVAFERATEHVAHRHRPADARLTERQAEHIGVVGARQRDLRDAGVVRRAARERDVH